MMLQNQKEEALKYVKNQSNINEEDLKVEADKAAKMHIF